MIGAVYKPGSSESKLNALARSGTNKTGLRASLPVAIGCTVALGAILLAAVPAAIDPIPSLGLINSGPFWNMQLTWIGVSVLAALALLVENRIVRTLAVMLFGVAVIGLLGYREPFGVFHDSWRNIGIGQLILSADHSEAAYQGPYVAGSPGGFILLGAIRMLFPDTASMLRLYPLFTVLAYCGGIYAMSAAYASVHFKGYAQSARNAAHNVRFPLMAVFAFLIISSIFTVRVNPAPQSIAFALLPFFLAAILRTGQHSIYRLLALVLYAAILLIHPITALMAAVICIAFWAADLMVRGHARPTVTINTVVLYACLFLSWLIYVGIWIVKAGSSFIERMLSVLNSGQHASVSAGGSAEMLDFIWTHRIAMAGAAVLILAGLIVAWKANRSAAMRLLCWFAVSAAWVPLMFLGEFADRGPLFASLPASLAIAFLLNMYCMSRSTKKQSNKIKLVKFMVAATVLATAVTGFATSYSNHVGEVITASELDAFHTIAAQEPGAHIAYGYVPPLTGDDLPVYLTDNIKAYALGAADFSYDRLLRQSGVIAISAGMAQAIEMRGGKQFTDYTQFLSQLNDVTRYELIYSNDFVKAYRAR